MFSEQTKSGTEYSMHQERAHFKPYTTKCSEKSCHGNYNLHVIIYLAIMDS